jgi:hypothetical protein
LRSASFFILKGTPPQEQNKTIFSGLKYSKFALPDQIDFPAFYRFRKMTCRNLINSGLSVQQNNVDPYQGTND